MFPSKVKIFNVVYTIEYVDKPSDVDVHRRDSLWGQIDHWTCSIRIYKVPGNDSSALQTLWHEIIHGIAVALHIKVDGELNQDERSLDLLATGVLCVLQDNGWLKIGEPDVEV